MKRLNIALVAHDSRKRELFEWCQHNAEWLDNHNLYATGTTAKLLSTVKIVKVYSNIPLEDDVRYLNVNPLLSGPLGGDQEIGAMVAHGKIDMLIFFCDNLITQGHHNDVLALTRLVSLYNIFFATNRSTADALVTSSLITADDYKMEIPDVIEGYKNRNF